MPIISAIKMTIGNSIGAYSAVVTRRNINKNIFLTQRDQKGTKHVVVSHVFSRIESKNMVPCGRFLHAILLQ